MAELVIEKRSIAERALMAAAGVMVDATVDRERAVPGEELTVGAEIWVGGAVEVESQGVFLLRPFSNEMPALAAKGVSDRTGVAAFDLTFRLPATTAPTVPYYLRRPRRGDLYDWSEVHPIERGEPREHPPVAVWFELVIEGVPISFAREAVYRYGDQASGEVRRPLRVVPVLEVEVQRGPILWNRAATEQLTLEAVVRSNVDREIGGRVQSVPPWDCLALYRADAPFELDAGRREQLLEIPYEVPGSHGSRMHEIPVSVVREDAAAGESGSALSLPVIEYPHIRPTPSPQAGTVTLSVFDLELPALERVGYVVGASDRVPAVLTALGVPLELLTADALARGDLSGFDAIVVGSRAYEIDPALAAANERLLDFARGGGTLIVQYQQYQFVRGEYAPFELSIARPHGRVTDETAPIEVLVPDHPAFQRPNRIDDEDWEDWVQERGLYFAESWGDAYRPLLSLTDPGRESERGALLVAPIGDGVYVYTGLSFFRQLPAGVPGAIRLFANLLALGSE